MTTPLDTAAARAAVSLFCDSEHRTAQTDELCVIVEQACTEIDALRVCPELTLRALAAGERLQAEVVALRERLKAAEAACEAADMYTSRGEDYIEALLDKLAAWRAPRGRGT